MNRNLLQTASEIQRILESLPHVQRCALYGSLAENRFDELSDIDLEVDVSGYDNGKFMLELPRLLKNKLPIYYVDYAPSLIPEKYIVSLAIDESNPFLIVDVCCTAEPHCTTVAKQQAMRENYAFTHMLKLWTANFKHYARGVDCYDDILRMAGKLKIENCDAKEKVELLEEVLCWLESNVDADLATFVDSCRCKFEELC